MPMLRGTLLYLAFPGYFLPIISMADKKAIRNAHSYRLDHDPGDLDRDLYEITLGIQNDVGRFHFYDHPYIPAESARTLSVVLRGADTHRLSGSAYSEHLAGRFEVTVIWVPAIVEAGLTV
jgi:hypothetical protein